MLGNSSPLWENVQERKFTISDNVWGFLLTFGNITSIVQSSLVDTDIHVHS